jgi:hypothetical protein
MERNPAFMIQKMLLYAITDRNQLPGSEAERSAALVELARQWVRGGVDYLQIREKDLSPEELLPLARQIIEAVRSKNKNPAERGRLPGPRSQSRRSTPARQHSSGSSSRRKRKIRKRRDRSDPKPILPLTRRSSRSSQRRLADSLRASL